MHSHIPRRRWIGLLANNNPLRFLFGSCVLVSCPGQPGTAWSVPGPRLNDREKVSLVQQVAVVCEQQRIGNTIWTSSCPDGHICRRKTDKEMVASKSDAKFTCEPGPEIQRQQAKKAQEDWARNHKLEVERGNADTERQLQEFERRSRDQTASDRIIPTLPNQARIRPALPGTQYRPPAQQPPAPSSHGGSNAALADPGAIVGAVIGIDSATHHSTEPSSSRPQPLSASSQSRGAGEGNPRGTAAAANATPIPRMWDGSRENCKDANAIERSTAGWVFMCDLPPPRTARFYRPNPDPLELSRSARAACGSY